MGEAVIHRRRVRPVQTGEHLALPPAGQIRARRRRGQVKAQGLGREGSRHRGLNQSRDRAAGAGGPSRAGAGAEWGGGMIDEGANGRGVGLSLKKAKPD